MDCFFWRMWQIKHIIFIKLYKVVVICKYQDSCLKLNIHFPLNLSFMSASKYSMGLVLGDRKVQFSYFHSKQARLQWFDSFYDL